MHSQSLSSWQHDHVFLGERHGRNENRTWIVVLITLAMMAVEIVGGSIFQSMALVADGWHMATHAAALAIAAFGYRFARQHLHDSRFSFGTGKFGELAAFTSAISLALVAIFIAVESVDRLLNPVAIRFNEAIAIAVVGLAVNLLCAWLLRDDHHHHGHSDRHRHGGHGHEDRHEHRHGDHAHHDHIHRHGHAAHDHNLRAAYIHVLSDALTSILAIVALVTARAKGWVWMDAAVGIVGAGVIAVWAASLIRASGAVLLDMVPDPSLLRQARARLEIDGDRVSDLHLWRLGPGHSALIAVIVSDTPEAPEFYKRRLAGLSGLSHVTIEVQACPHHGPARAVA